MIKQVLITGVIAVAFIALAMRTSAGASLLNTVPAS